MKKIIKTLLVVMVLVLALAAFTSCGTVIESFKHIGHDVMTLPAIAPTCAKEGLEEGLYCNDCHVVVVEQKTIAKLEHEMVPNEDRAPTCNLVGLQGGTHCKHCGLPNGEQVEVPVIDCIYGEPYVYQAPTCGKDGFYAMDCTMCGTAKKGDVIPATGEHSFTVDVAAKDPTCGADGYTAHKDCDVCGAHDEDYELLNATGEHSFTVDVEAKDPTCVEVGYNAHKDCDVCGAHDETYVEVPADEENGHSFPEEDWFVGQAPTCTEPGIMAGVCEHCGEAYGLFYIDPTHVDENEDGICDVCEEEIPAEEEPECEHVWGEGEVTTAPTCTTAGVKTYTCTVEGCGATKTEDVAATGHTDANADAKCDVCEAYFLPEVGTAFVLKMNHEGLSKIVYFNGTKGNYYFNIGDYTTAATLYLEATEGGYYMYMGTDTKTYINLTVSGKYVNAALSETASTVWVWNAELGILTTYVEVTEDTSRTGNYYLGTYGDKNDLRPVQLEKNPDNYKVYAVVVPAHECDGEATCTKLATCSVCGLTHGELKAHDYTAVAATCTTNAKCACGAALADSALGHTTENGVCERCNTVIGEGSEPVDAVLPENLVFTGVANKANADSYMKTNFPEWSITGKLGQTYENYLGFGRSGDGKSAITSSDISTTTAFKVKTVLKGNGSSGVATSTLTFTLVDADGNVVATGYAEGSTTAAITPADGKDTTYTISFTFVEGKTWTDVSNLVVTFAKATGNIGLKSLEFVQ